MRYCGWFALILTAVFVFQNDCLGQKQNIEVVFQGNSVFPLDILQKELDKCLYKFEEITEYEELGALVSICLRGTVYELYAEKGMWIGSKLISQVKVENSSVGKKVVIPLEEVEPVYLGNLNIPTDSLKLISKEQFLEGFPVKRGEIVNYVAIRNYYQKLRDLYYNNGYLEFDLDFEDETYTNSENGKKTKDYTLKISEGKPFIIKSIRFKRNENLNTVKNEKLTDELLEKTLGLKIGQIYSEEKLQKRLKKLNNIGGFSEVEILVKLTFILEVQVRL